jgi:predicted secreted protein
MVVAEAMMDRMQTLPRTIGATLVYDYGSRVTLRSEADMLRLSLGQQDMEVRTWAEANPTVDQTAYRLAEFVNTGGELLLPGQATLILDGAVVGYADLPLTAPGAKTELGFGPIDGLQVEAQYPSAREGDVGIISRSNEQERQTVLIARNLTGQDWDLTLTAGLSYADQDDLEITHVFSTDPARVDPDGQRGIVEWDLTLAAGAETRITVDETLEWPTGYILQ